MTISATTAWGSAMGTGITGPYAIPFSLYNQTDLTVLLVTNNVPTTMALGTDYSFTSWTPDNKGQVASPAITFTNGVAGGTLIVFLLTPPPSQLTSITNQSAYFPALHEARFDQLDQMDLRLLEWAKKTIKAPDQEQGGATSLTLPPVASRYGKVLGFDANGNILMLGVPPAVVSILSCVANDYFTSAGASVWAKLVGNKITLTPGTWMIFGNCQFHTQAGTSQVTIIEILFGSTNGNDDTNSPAVISGNFKGGNGVVESAASDPATYLVGVQNLSSQACVAVSVNTDVFIDAVVVTNSGNEVMKMNASMVAYKVSDATS